MKAIEDFTLVGKTILRREDSYLMRGKAQFLDDLPEPKGLIHIAFVLSPYARADILSVDASAAKALPGVIDVLTGRDFAGDIKLFAPVIEIGGYRPVGRPVVAVDRVNFVGEYVAVILAESPYVAQDALDLVDVSYDPLPSVAGIRDAMKPDAPVLHDHLGDNLIFKTAFETEGFADRFAEGDVVLEEEFRLGRVTGVMIEPRGCMACPDPIATNLTLWTPTQIPHIVRTAIADHLDIAESVLRVVTPAVGGGFGTKAHVYPDELIVVALARRYGRAVKWVQDRREELLTNAHAREHVLKIRIAAKTDGEIRAVHLDVKTNCGAYPNHPYSPTLEATAAVRMMPGPYRIRNYKYDVCSVTTNTAPTGAYRGTGQPSAFLAIEGMMDRIGRRLGLDPADVRRRNVIRPEEFPYVNVVGVRYDTGSYSQSLERGLEMIGYDAFRAAQPKDRLVDGKYRGIGICNYTEVSGTGAPGWRVRGFAKMPGFDSSRVVVEPDGKVTVYISQADAGQGHYTTFAQLAADRLGVDWADVTVVEGDTSKTPYGTGTFASRGSVVGGGTVIRCSEKVGVKIRRLAGYMLNADPERLVLRDGRVFDPDDAARGLTLREVAETAYSMNNLGLPQGEEHGLEATDYYDPPMVTMANGTHVVQVAVDPEDGRIEIERYAVVHDCGRVINPKIVEGQVHGATVQGIGEALMEEIVYDAEGQHLNANLLDYLLPTAMDVPDLELSHIETPSIDTVGGIKGAAEGGLTGAVPALANAVCDALSGLGVNITRVPLRPSFVLEQIRNAQAAGEGRT
ncbi:xanthine dehydrogenase family protein molybdopterin-binding subunit [Albidovulum sp.]|jgi:carbon-monoxide dehydrogenase large subunit|uniref:xanthine dehydrogenase family protein molybdopterin-binding subunit n=2 Tax=Albidovulum sp. TaxID=1872424 RepID=UPI00303983E0